jgi:acyl-CoA dehydrogenase
VESACRDHVRRLGQAGWLRWVGTNRHGGPYEHHDLRSLCLIREILARHAPLADFAFALQGLGSAPIALSGSDELEDAYLPAVMSGEKVAAFALSESEAGSDVAMTTARREVIYPRREKTGQQSGIADLYVVFTRWPEGGNFCLLVDAGPRPGSHRDDQGHAHPWHVTLKRHGEKPSAIRGTASRWRHPRLFRTTVGAAALGFARRA